MNFSKSVSKKNLLKCFIHVKTKPCKISDKLLGKPITVKHSNKIHGEARAQTYRNEVLVSDKFLKLTDTMKQHIFTHELGHFLETRLLKNPKDFWLVSDSGIFGEGKVTRRGDPYFEGILGTFNTGEAVAEGYATYRLNPTFLKKNHPNVYNFFREIERGTSVKNAVKKVRRYW